MLCVVPSGCGVYVRGVGPRAPDEKLTQRRGWLVLGQDLEAFKRCALAKRIVFAV